MEEDLGGKRNEWCSLTPGVGGASELQPVIQALRVWMKSKLMKCSEKCTLDPVWGRDRHIGALLISHHDPLSSSWKHRNLKMRFLSYFEVLQVTLNPLEYSEYYIVIANPICKYNYSNITNIETKSTCIVSKSAKNFILK